MVLASEDHGHVLVTINITKAPVFAITINGIIISDNNHHHSHQYKQHLPHCPIHPLIIINASINASEVLKKGKSSKFNGEDDGYFILSRFLQV